MGIHSFFIAVNKLSHERKFIGLMGECVLMAGVPAIARTVVDVSLVLSIGPKAYGTGRLPESSDIFLREDFSAKSTLSTEK